MDWIKKLTLKMVWPLIKKKVIEYIESEEWQKKLVERINDKLDIPRISEATEKKIINQMYDAAQELAVEFVDGIDVDNL
ncbi:MAG: hypothetical protein ACOC56_05260 [Atribacterota bacterium]